MWPFKKKKILEIKIFDGKVIEGEEAFRLITWWDDMKPDWEYLYEHNSPTICAHLPAGWYSGVTYG